MCPVADSARPSSRCANQFPGRRSMARSSGVDRAAGTAEPLLDDALGDERLVAQGVEVGGTFELVDRGLGILPEVVVRRGRVARGHPREREANRGRERRRPRMPLVPASGSGPAGRERSTGCSSVRPRRPASRRRARPARGTPIASPRARGRRRRRRPRTPPPRGPRPPAPLRRRARRTAATNPPRKTRNRRSRPRRTGTGVGTQGCADGAALRACAGAAGTGRRSCRLPRRGPGGPRTGQRDAVEVVPVRPEPAGEAGMAGLDLAVAGGLEVVPAGVRPSRSGCRSRSGSPRCPRAASTAASAMLPGARHPCRRSTSGLILAPTSAAAKPRTNAAAALRAIARAASSSAGPRSAARAASRTATSVLNASAVRPTDGREPNSAGQRRGVTRTYTSATAAKAMTAPRLCDSSSISSSTVAAMSARPRAQAGHGRRVAKYSAGQRPISQRLAVAFR